MTHMMTRNMMAQLRMWHDTYDDMEYDGVLMMMKDKGSDGKVAYEVQRIRKRYHDKVNAELTQHNSK